MNDEQPRDGQDPSGSSDPSSDPSSEPSDEDFAEAWERSNDLDVGADTSRFETFRSDDTAELLRRQVRDDDAHDDPPDPHVQPDASRDPGTAVIIGVLVAVFAVVTVLYLLN